MDRLDGNSFRNLKEAYYNSASETSIAARQWAESLIFNEDFDFSEYTWEEVYAIYEAYSRSGEQNNKSDKDAVKFINRFGRGVKDFFNPDPKKSNEPNVRSGDYTPDRGLNDYTPSRDRQGRQYGNQSNVAPEKTSGLSSAEQARLKREADKRRKAGQTADLRGGAETRGVQSTSKSKGTSSGSGSKTAQSSSSTSSSKSSQTAQSKNVASTSSTASRPQPTKQTGNKSADMAAWRKANPSLAKRLDQKSATRGTSASSNPQMKDLKSRLPTSKATSSSSSSTQSSSSPSIKSSRLRNALSDIKPMKKLGEDVDNFDLVLGHLIGEGFYPEEAMELMLNMSSEKVESILSRIQEEDDRKDGYGRPLKKDWRPKELRISQEAKAKRDAMSPAQKKAEQDKNTAERRRRAEAAAKADKRSDSEKMADAYASIYKGPGGARRAD